MKRTVFLVAVGLVLARVAPADTIIDTYPDWDGGVTSGWFKIAQSFTAPTDNVLRDWKFALNPPDGQDTVSFEVFAWDENVGPVGDALYSTVADWPADGGDVLVEDINLELTEGSLYGVVIDLLGYSGQSVHWQRNQDSYSEGNASWWNGSWQFLNSAWNTKFRATFSGASCEPCDANCDGSVDLTDVEPFIKLLFGEDPCAFCTGDTNDDGSIDLTDVEGFIECLLG